MSRTGLRTWDTPSTRAKLSVSRYNLSANVADVRIEHRISGYVLGLMDHEHLKDIGIKSVGQRLAILKAVYQLKVAYDIPIEPDGYIPPCEFFV